jgi:transcription elongation factor Elf1
MTGKRIVRAYYRDQQSTLQYKFLRCEDCNALLVTAGEMRAGMVRCPVCNLAWSVDRLGLIMSEGKYYVKEE